MGLSNQVKMATPSKVLEGYKSGDKERLRLEHKFSDLIEEELWLNGLVSYVGNKSIPFLRLYRYKEAFAFEFVRHFIKRFGLTANDYIFDPFAGIGTTLFASMLEGISSVGIDRLPIATFVAETLPKFLFIKEGELTSAFKKLKHSVQDSKPSPIAEDVPIIKLAFDEKIF